MASCWWMIAVAPEEPEKRVVSFISAFRVYSFVTLSATGERSTEASSPATSAGSGLGVSTRYIYLYMYM